MERVCRYLSVFLALLTLRVAADCTSYGVDYSNGGTYSIDVSSNQYFSFITVFQGMYTVFGLSVFHRLVPGYDKGWTC